MTTTFYKSTALDPTVISQLQQHLLNIHQGNAAPLKLGSEEQLAVGTKILSSNQISECFIWNEARSYPALLKRNYLVACVNQKKDVKVVAIYTLNQMNQIQSEFNSGYSNQIEWRILEISKELESDLLTSNFLR